MAPRSRRRRTERHTAAAALALAAAAAVQAQDDPAPQQVQIVAASPLPGLGLALRDVPANVQVFGSREAERQQPASAADLLARNAASVSVNDAQGNRYQPDLGFRGFTASPLLGMPQGLSVYVDGVRVNQAFGDVVHWDLLPTSAIATIQLLPGSNPVFGLNTLGGAIVVQTMRGRDDAGSEIALSTGSFGLRSVRAEHGGQAGAWDWYATAHLAREDGWALHNASRIAQLFAKLGHCADGHEIDLSFSAADNELQGTQTLPLSFLDEPRQPYTWPDTQRNRAVMLALQASQHFSEGRVLGASAYLRRHRNSNLGSNVADDGDDGAQGSNELTRTAETGWGLGLQLTVPSPGQQLQLGLSLDGGDTGFTRETQPVSFDATRGAQPLAAFAPETDAGTHNRAFGLFAQYTRQLSPAWTLNASGRYNDLRVRVADRSGLAPQLDGSHRFRRFNPALGLNFHPGSDWTAYASLSQGMRAPTPMELTCADPDAPCKLPNAFIADPPLEPVIARTLELGARGTQAATRWSAALYRSELRDDIQFIGSGASLAGYFRNVGRTERLGLELAASTRWDHTELSARYSRLQATYRSAFVEHSPNNPSADAQGNIAIHPGDRLAGLPRDSLKLRLDRSFGPHRLGLSVVANSASVARGDENRGSGFGRVPGFAVLHADGELRLGAHLVLALRVDNLLDRRYANFGLLGRNLFTGPGRSYDVGGGRDEPFRGLGAPRGVGIELRWSGG